MKTHKNHNAQSLIRSMSRLTMLPLLYGLLSLGLAVSGMAAERENLDQRIRQLTHKFEAMQDKPDKAIPSELLRKAQGIVLLDGTKAGLLSAYQHAGGVAMVKNSQT